MEDPQFYRRKRSKHYVDDAISLAQNLERVIVAVRYAPRSNLIGENRPWPDEEAMIAADNPAADAAADAAAVAAAAAEGVDLTVEDVAAAVNHAGHELQCFVTKIGKFANELSNHAHTVWLSRIYMPNNIAISPAHCCCCPAADGGDCDGCDGLAVCMVKALALLCHCAARFDSAAESFPYNTTMVHSPINDREQAVNDLKKALVDNLRKWDSGYRVIGSNSWDEIDAELRRWRDENINYLWYQVSQEGGMARCEIWRSRTRDVYATPRRRYTQSRGQRWYSDYAYEQ
ncbi:hypothetical protein SPI_07741 [Niveomyces insectorum RCEF 264]|uniref:Uncharacterized protein n=1 Tax=Niveomyces insectorum RCEF 264 TaxID=1081102 RepID=A0A167PJV6_9HYPO|nr:hypothetical protein SPI_07741 [Niveomyces insectorum RCEF 264]